MRLLIATVCVGAAVALAAPSAQGIGIPAKLKGKKVQGDLVPAYAPADTGSGTGDDEGKNPAILDTPELRSDSTTDSVGHDCTFLQGKFKAQVGKDIQLKLKGVTCGGTPYNGMLCAHTKTLSTIMDEEIDKEGNSTPVVCIAPDMVQHTENSVSWVTGAVGTISCVDGSCQGTIPPVTADPCPDVDKVSEIRRLEVFDGPDKGTTTINGATIGACCGPTQTFAGPFPVAGIAPCNASTQDVMAEMGQVVQGVQP